VTDKTDYQLLDSGCGKWIEQIGPYLLIRPAAHALWPRKLPESFWKKAHAEFQGSLDGGQGKWVFHRPMEKKFEITLMDISMECRLNDYGHVGVFFEQKENWLWLKKNALKKRHYLNLFGYTGMSSLGLAASGAKVTHVDASKPVLNWARHNAMLSKIPADSIRFIWEDALTYVRREEKRGASYDGIVMDPPTFGRGAEGEIWKIEKNLMPLLQICKKILSPQAHLFLLSGHSHGFSPLVLKNCLSGIFPEKEATMECGEMHIHETKSQRVIPVGFFARWAQSAYSTDIIIYNNL
jgi:23S rRNA (cytosine1962-C5)-methyltransferase